MSHTVLIVDDSKLARLVVIKALTALRPDWPRVEAADAEKALAIAAEQPIDIALLDFNMPGINGLDLAAMLRERHPTMPIVVISANIQDEIIARARELDAAFLPKPVTEEALGAFLSGAALRLRTSKR
jgi:CheY-like chemotaxis protein